MSRYSALLDWEFRFHLSLCCRYFLLCKEPSLSRSLFITIYWAPISSKIPVLLGIQAIIRIHYQSICRSLGFYLRNRFCSCYPSISALQVSGAPPSQIQQQKQNLSSRGWSPQKNDQAHCRYYDHWIQRLCLLTNWLVGSFQVQSSLVSPHK